MPSVNTTECEVEMSQFDGGCCKIIASVVNCTIQESAFINQEVAL